MLNLISDRLTKKAHQVLEKASLDSGETNWKKIDCSFLLKSLLNTKNSLGRLVLKKYFQNKKSLPPKNGFSVFEIMAEALQLATLNKSSYVGTEHLANGFLILQEKKNPKKIPLSKEIPTLDDEDLEEVVFPQQNSFQPNFFQDLNSLISNFFSQQTGKNKSNNFLEKFCLNLNAQAQKENYALIGRETEVERISHILARRNKNNPVLVGEPGVGKTAIVEGLAEKINRHCAGFQLNGKKILSLDLGLLLAGTNFRGEFESRLKEIISSAKNNRDIILFIDEIHTLVGAGNAVGGMDAANILKPALSRGEIQIIGATTLDEYRKYIEKDAALERRLQPIFVNEPSEKESATILSGIKKHYEAHHHLKIPQELLAETIALAKEYLPERFLPDSAIDLLDEASALRCSKLKGQEIYVQISRQKELLAKLCQQKEFLILNGHYDEAVKARQEEQEIEKNLKKLKKDLLVLEKKQTTQLRKEDIWQVLSRSARIPLELLTKKNQNIPQLIKEKLTASLVGQEEIIEKIHQTLARQFSGIASSKRPLGSFLFIGAAGVGKTFSAQLLAQNLSPTGKENLIQINMSELTENHSVSRLLGAPAGYVGYEESGELTEKIRRNPYSVVLFDELEKAGTSALNLLLRILEEGILTDSKGKTIDFRHSIIVLASNFATDELNKVSQIGFSQKEEASLENSFLETKKSILKEAEEFFPKELLDRLDHVLVFNNLKTTDLEKIAQRELDRLKKKLKSKNVFLSFPEKIAHFIAEKSFQPNQGARIIRKTIQDKIENVLAEFLLKNPRPKDEKLFCQIGLDQKNNLTIKKIAPEKNHQKNQKLDR